MINWDPTGGARYENGNYVTSAAMALAHEMGHAAQHLEGLFDGKTIGQIENDNVKRYETPIANELGEYTRKKYGGGTMYRMDNSTDWGVLNFAY